MARPPKAKAIERLKKALDAISDLRNLQSGSPEFMEWRESTRIYISHIFGDHSNRTREFERIYFSTPSPFYRIAYEYGLNSASALLKSMIEEIEDYWEDEKQAQIHSGTQANGRPSSNEVFVIHGRDEGIRELVARFLEKLGLKSVILQEQPNEGRTLIEKFEDHAHVAFAVALLTPDDVGSLQDDKNNLSPRARQNVIFELGFFIGRLGRNGVCALTKGDVEIPSDYAGVMYIPLDRFDGWKQKLFQELKTAGFQLDADRAFQP
ncbi:MAG: nucleotide-binding protein [Nitrospira sp. SB0667_bin_9]|nr:nucleotide-binding protein [Nitrospira sp. SB0667_bin_9]MYD30939.1 nucleotide-binding protein [Nitrospira sp. SB0661_bin_20]MYJ21957.1 nucleotide-binding protein [Nitrospira sp. SB0673_bin_12]